MVADRLLTQPPPQALLLDGKHVTDPEFDDQTTDVYSSNTEYKHQKCALCVPKNLPDELKELINEWNTLPEYIKEIAKLLFKSDELTSSG